ncbi:GNAT family N-acetyltransferase [Comamonas sp. GB3 AK4-5]|uniref:GNAT family N-acetyltransferase n=1 Tax=Comamonas sp. GB3 AK4-5 TaxID=3231487 RepID=UPI00351E4F67
MPSSPSSPAHIRLLAASDAPALWAFERAHRAYFEQWVQARPERFYSAPGFAEEMAASLQRQDSDQAFHYLIWEGEALVGRINLTQVRRTHFHSASLGYRVAPDCGGRGLASLAVEAVLQQAFSTHQLQRIEAVARPENQASVRVLQKQGFTQFGHSRRSFELHGQWFDLLCFERHREAF